MCRCSALRVAPRFRLLGAIELLRLVVEEFSSHSPLVTPTITRNEDAPADPSLREQRDALLRAYRSLQARLGGLDRPGWAHDYDEDLRRAGVKL